MYLLINIKNRLIIQILIDILLIAFAYKYDNSSYDNKIIIAIIASVVAIAYFYLHCYYCCAFVNHIFVEKLTITIIMVVVLLLLLQLSNKII